MLKEINMKQFLYLLVLALMPMCFTACGGDDDSGSSGPGSNDIVGTWQLIRSEGWEGSSDNSYDETYGDTGPIITFNADGTYTSGGKQGNYTYGNGVLTIGDVTMKATVSGNLLVIESSTKTRYEKSTLRRVGSSSGSSDSDDPNPGTNVANLVGLWEMIHIKGVTDDDEGNLVEYDLDVTPFSLDQLEELDICDYCRYQFTADKQFTLYDYKDDKFSGEKWIENHSTTYDYNGKTLTFNYSDHKETVTVLSLTKDRLVLYEKVNDSHEYYENTTTFKLIK